MGRSGTEDVCWYTVEDGTTGHGRAVWKFQIVCEALSGRSDDI